MLNRTFAAYWKLDCSMSMPNLPPSLVTNIADPSFRLRMMLRTVSVVHAAGDLWFPLLNLISTFIDGLASGPKGGARAAYLAYLRQHFPNLCAAITPEDFYEYLRSASVHEFGVRPPFALWRDSDLGGRYLGDVQVAGSTFKAFNIDRLYADFVAHLRSLGASP